MSLDLTTGRACSISHSRSTQSETNQRSARRRIVADRIRPSNPRSAQVSFKRTRPIIGSRMCRSSSVTSYRRAESRTPLFLNRGNPLFDPSPFSPLKNRSNARSKSTSACWPMCAETSYNHGHSPFFSPTSRLFSSPRRGRFPVSSYWR
jgi:hypothetical protein